MKRSLIPVFAGTLLCVLIFTVLFACQNNTNNSSDAEQNRDTVSQSAKAENELSSKSSAREQDSTVYETKNLVIKQVSRQVYKHTSFMQTKDYGNVPCNGMIVIDGDEAIVFDTPTDEKSSVELLNFARNNGWSVKSVVATHFHEDCIGGLKAFSRLHIPCYASNRTLTILKQKSSSSHKLLQGFDDSLALKVGNKQVHAFYPGEGHTKDNIIGYYPYEKALFGGCLIKEMGATKGNVADANLTEWPLTVEKVKARYPNAQIVIPGHGNSGGAELLDYSIRLFSNN
jgi:metallo-beta-lactamase class B